MNYLAHAFLARSDEGLMLGGLLGDDVRGKRALLAFPPDVRRGIRLHRFIDRTTDHHAEMKPLLRRFRKPFRRYAGIIVDIAFDHFLACHWQEFSARSLREFDQEIRVLLHKHQALVPTGLRRFMAYADRRGLFAAYRDEEEMLHSLYGVGRRLQRKNPLDRVDEIWPEVSDACEAGFLSIFPQIQAEVDDWVNETSAAL